MGNAFIQNVYLEGICDTVVKYDGDGWSVLEPRHAVCTDDDNNSPSNPEYDDFWTELKTMAAIVVFATIAFLLFIIYRSCKRTEVDWYRLLGIYIVGTLMFVISLIIGPSGGFNRIVGFGVLAHNMAEWFIIARMWFGKHSTSYKNGYLAKGIALYIIIFTSLLAIGPLQFLYWLLMAQGAFCDWTLVYTFLKVEKHLKNFGGRYFWIAVSAALTHVLSIQSMFYGLALGCSVGNYVTLLFLVPTFVQYLWFATHDSDSPVLIIDPNPTGINMLNAKRNEEIETLIELQSSRNETDKEKEEEEEKENQDNENSKKTKEEKHRKNIIQHGLIGDPDINDPWEIITCVAIWGLISTIIDSLIVVTSPCYVKYNDISGGVAIAVSIFVGFLFAIGCIMAFLYSNKSRCCNKTCVCKCQV